jgi:hypothetical protein
MKIRCVSRTYSNSQRKELGVKDFLAPEFSVVPGREYLVLGITVRPLGSPYGAGAFFEILTDEGACSGVPACLFEVVDDRCSKYWKIRFNPDRSFSIWPEEFFIRFFHDDLSEGVAASKAAFQQVVDRLSEEFD